MQIKYIPIHVIFIYIFSTFLSVYAEVEKGSLGIALNYPGVGIKYVLFNKMYIELKSQFAEDVNVSGIRGILYLVTNKKLLYFLGIESDYISFKGEKSKGTGFAIEPLIGGEYFFNKKFSVQLDCGPALIALTDKGTSESVCGFEYVINFGINYYFTRLGK